jgi:hypothetical protein
MLLAGTVADELLACLRAIAVPPPYLLVGHSRRHRQLDRLWA